MATNYISQGDITIKGAIDKTLSNEGPVTVTTNLNFATTQTYIFDPTMLQQGMVFSTVKAMFVDNSTNPEPVYVTVDTSGQYFPIPPYSSGWYKITANENSKITMQSDGGATRHTPVLFTNYDQEPIVWFGFAPLVDGANVIVRGVDLITPVGVTNPFIVGGYDGADFRTLLTDATGRLIVSGASGGGVAYGPDVPGAFPTNPPVQLGGVDPGGLVRRILTTVAGLLRVSVDTSVLPTGAATEVTSADILARANLLGTEVTSAAILARANLLGTEATSAAILASVTRGATATVTVVTPAGADTLVLASAATRKSWSVYNSGTVTQYLRFGPAAASATDYSIPLVAGAFYENSTYNGEVRAFGASGDLRVTSNV